MSDGSQGKPNKSTNSTKKSFGWSLWKTDEGNKKVKSFDLSDPLCHPLDMSQQHLTCWGTKVRCYPSTTLVFVNKRSPVYNRFCNSVHFVIPFCSGLSIQNTTPLHLVRQETHTLYPNARSASINSSSSPSSTSSTFAVSALVR